MRRLHELLFDAAERFPDRQLRVHEGESFTFPALRDAALRAAGGAVADGVRPGEPVLLLVDDIADFFVAFWGVLLAGATPVPLAGPRGDDAEERARIGRVAAMLGGPVVVDRGVRLPGARDVGAWRDGASLSGPIDRDAPALVQFSSGSTREPRGVVLTHANLLANVAQLARALPLRPDDVKLTWMPHFHDMGLIGCHLLPLSVGMEQVRMTALRAMRDPLDWLRAASAHRATILSATNFALDRTARRLSGGLDVDLSSVRMVVNGAEPISAAVCAAFSARTGLPDTVHFPLYGLAEASVGVTASRAGGVRVFEVGGRRLVGVGAPLDGVQVRIDAAVAGVGRVLVRGPNVSAGYWGEAPGGDEIDTGDLGALIDGQLVIAGRAKDVVVVNGRNHHAHDLEAVIEAVAGVRPGGAVALADWRGDVEGVAVVVEVDRAFEAAPVLWAVRRAVTAEVGVAPTDVLPLGRIPRTTSGKRRRGLLRSQLASGALDDAVGSTVALVRGAWEQALGRRLGDDELDAGFAALGGTSVMAIDALVRIEAALGVVPDHRLLLDADSVNRLARRLERVPPAVLPPPRVAADEPIAVIAAACRLPGASDPEGFFEGVRAGRVAIGPVQRWSGPERWRGGFIDDVDRFDAARFGIGDAEAAAMDPQQRLVLTLAVEALAGVDRPDVGVFVGAGQLAYAEVVREHLSDDLPAGTLAGNLLSMLAARVSHHLDLRGPALTVDTACSASLVAVHLACRSLLAGECGVALAGGVNLNLSPTLHRLFDVAGAMSPTGRCRPFHDDADGTVPGEGAVVLALARLSDARDAGWPVLGVIRGTAMNNDGRSLGVMAPNPAGQKDVIERALAAAGVSAADVAFVETHGAGTRVGDRVEAAVLDRCYPHGPRRGAIKGQIGHLMGAAGAAGLLRLIGELAPGELGAVSSFGFGGTNAHAIVEGAAGRTRAVERVRGRRYWLGRGFEEEAEAPQAAPLPAPPPDLAWVHEVTTDPAGGLTWREAPVGPSPLRDGGRYLITGGAGALGSALARYLASRYGAELVLVGRSAPERHDALLVELGRASYIAADLATDAAAVLAAGPFDGAFHLAGTVGPDAMAPKRDGFLALEALDTGFWCLFSSISAVIPGLDAGIEAYARANAWLDRAAIARHRLGQPIVSVAWGPWEGAGLAAAHADALRARGVAPIAPDDAMRALERALGSGRPHVVVLPRPRATASARPADLAARVRALIAGAAGLEPDDVRDDRTLTELGVDSVQALDLVKELEALVGHGLPSTLLYEHDTLGGIVRALGDDSARRDAPAPVAPDDRPGVPLLPSQQTFVVQRAFFPDMPGNVFLAVTVAPALDRDRLAAALDTVCARHPSLTAVARDGRQLDGLARPTVDWRDEIDEEAVSDEVFALEDGPLFRVITDGRRLVLNGHHAVVDAWSAKNVLEDLLAAYAGAELPPLRASWADAVAALRRPPTTSLDWWRERFGAGVPPLHLPWRAPVDEPSHGGAGAHRRVWGADETAALVAAARAAGVTLPALVLAAYVEGLYGWSGQPDVVVRVAHARREIRVPDVDRLVGSFADSLPVRVRADGQGGLVALARSVQAELAAVQAHADASSVALASLAHSPAGPVGLTPVGFSFPLLPAASEIGGHALSDVSGRAGAGFTRLALIAWVFDGRLHASLVHARSHLSAEQVRAFADDLAERLGHVHGEPARPTTLHGAVLARCRRHPERPAVGALTYGDLDRRSAALASRLDGPRIAVLADPGADAVVALLAALRTGAAYVPLVPSWPDARVRQVVEQAAPSMLVTTADLVERAGGFGLPVVAVTDDESDDGPEVEGALAYIMFTSGSTGRPKGVVVGHAAALAFQGWLFRVFGITERDRFLQTSSLGYGGSVRQIFTPLMAGGTVHPVSMEEARDPDALVEKIAREGITVWNSVPSLWVHLMDAAARSERPDPLASLRWVLVGGEAVPADLVRRWRREQGHVGARLANLYGSTETIVNATCFEVVRDPAPDDRHTPIGWDRGGTTVVLLDVVDGVGEIAVGGAIADGYWGEPELTAQAFVDHPQHGRLYRTGDLARRAPDGAIVFLGRRDAQVQVHGNRVELSEIEHTLVNHPDVQHAVVVYTDERLVATVQPRPGAAPADLRAWCEARLPHYMVPHRLALVDAMPRNSAGKADRTRVREEIRGAVADADLLVRLGRIWQEVLDLPRRPGPDDDFFALGGDSIRALEVLTRIRAVEGAVVRPVTVYRQRTLAALARVVADAPRSRPAATTAPAGPLSPVQRGFFTAHRRRPDHPPTWCAAVPVQGALDLPALQRAVDWLVARHPLLRTVFRQTPHGPAQDELPPRPLPVQYDDLSGLPDAVRDRALAARWDEEAAARFDPGTWPLLRVRVCRMGPERFVLVLGSHHIISDAWSCWVLASELVVAHDVFVEGRTPALPAPIAFRDAVADTEQDDPWWRANLADLAQAAAPAGEPRSDRISLPERVWDGVRAAARHRSVSPYLVVLTALFQSLSEVLGADDVVVATALASRDTPGAEAVVGPFARGLPVRVRGGFDLPRVAEAFVAASEHADASPASMAAGLGPDALERLGRFFLTWLDPSAVPRPETRLSLDWTAGRFRFATESTATELMISALAHDGLHLNLYGGPLVDRVRPVLERRLRALAAPDAALVVYAPDDLPIPISTPLVVERVDTATLRSELVLLPLSASRLAGHPDLAAAVRAAVAATDARVVALAGMLPSLTGLATRPLAGPGQVLTTGHAATVVAMLKTLERALAETGRGWTTTTVAALGYGSIGRAVLALARHVLGEPERVVIDDPAHPERGSAYDADLILGATSGGATLDVSGLRPGTIVIDDSFPRAFDDAAALRRMQRDRDVLLVGGGLLDAGPLERRSPFPQAAAIRAAFPAKWLPGCHAEALLIAGCPALGPTVGAVTLERALAVLAEVDRVGWTAPPLHLGTWVAGDGVVRGVSSGRPESGQ